MAGRTGTCVMALTGCSLTVGRQWTLSSNMKVSFMVKTGSMEVLSVEGRPAIA